MKQAFKMITLSATVILSLSMAGQSFAAASSFTDLDKVSAKDKIMALQQSGIVTGMTPELFAPYTTISQAQGVQLIVNALGLNLDLVRFVKEPKATDYFSHANNDAWYANALITAAVNGIELAADMDPNHKLSREEFTHQLIRAIEKSGNLPLINPVVVEIKDQDQMSAEYSGSIQRALKYGVIQLDAEGKLNPKGEISRAEAAEEVYNALEYLKAHPAPILTHETLTEEQGVQLIKDALGSVGTDLNFKIDPNATMTRESFTYLLVHTFQTSGKLPMVKVAPVEIKDNDQIESLHSGSIQTAIALGIISLNAEGKFNPKDGITRTDAAEMVTKAVEAAKKLTNHS